MAGESIEVYCDAGVSPASMVSPTASDMLPKPVGRIVVLIPSIDYGYIEQSKEGVLTKKGNPDPALLEAIAIKKARQICSEKKLADFTILTGRTSSAKAARFPEVEWLGTGKLQLASLFLQRIMNRARYLRSSSRKVISRPRPNEVQRDVFRLFNAQRLEFKLSRSALWNKIQSEIESARGGGQERLQA